MGLNEFHGVRLHVLAHINCISELSNPFTSGPKIKYDYFITE